MNSDPCKPSLPAPAFAGRFGDVVDKRRGAAFQELRSENLLNRLNGTAMPFGWTVNPFRGCEVGCRYCYARSTHEYLGHADPREFEERQPPYTFCIRTTAVYECPFYGSDGELRRIRRRVVAHGTGFAYRRQDAATLLLTNDHVAEWPVATTDERKVEGVPAGCRRVSDALKIVDGEDDRYEPDDVPLTRVVVDPQLDVAVLKAATALPVMPWKIGRSAALRERDVVNVRGVPLGVIRADPELRGNCLLVTRAGGRACERATRSVSVPPRRIPLCSFRRSGSPG